MSTLGVKIKKLRELRNLTQGHMAEKLGISQSAYSKIELDETNVGYERLEQIARALDVSVQDVLAFDEKMFFSVMHNQNSSVGYVVHNNVQLAEKEREHYEEKIKLLEDKIKLLTEKCELLSEEVKRLKKE
ncbi:MAG: helix-turn-helix domain-containing protein [Sporocytophaga sp.]|nr:helix-turn-helix domain-containing protein [Sporocytophaga sp.]